MSAASVTWRRTLGIARNAYTTALSVAGFVALSAVVLVFNLNAESGGRLSFVSVWTMSVAAVLPALAAFLAMDVWSNDRLTGRLDILLSSAVRERELVLGKFLGVFSMLMASVGLFLVLSVSSLAFCVPEVLIGVKTVSFLPGLFTLILQGALWSAVAVTMSAMTQHGATAACASVGLLVALPRAFWAGLRAWSPLGQSAFGEMPLDAHAIDFSSGVITTGPLIAYLVLTVVMLFVATKVISSYRLVGRGARGLRVTTFLSIALSLVFAGLTLLLAVRLNRTVDVPVGSADSRVSPRMRSILAESSGDISISCFLPRNDFRFRTVGRFLRGLKREADATGGSRLEIRFVDPHWDLGAAERLIRLGAKENSLVFERSRRVAVVPLEDGYDEGVCASALRRIALPPLRRTVFWTIGHGECRFDEYGPFGMSDIARELSREGYSNEPLNLLSDAQGVPDCALVVVAGAKKDFSRVELGRLDAYLRRGGRLLVLLGAEQGGVASVLSSWGVRPMCQPLVDARTVSGTDVIVSDYTEHVVVAPLKGTQIILDRPFLLSPSAATEGGAGADRLEFSSLAKVGAQIVAAAVERGAGARTDLAIRPTRIVVVGDSSFVMNGLLSSRANANKDFFMNCVAYLSGTDVSAASGRDGAIVLAGIDRMVRVRLVLVLCGIVPVVVLFLLGVSVYLRRRRK